MIAALRELRYPCPNDDNNPEIIILAQTVYLCQLFLHLQEFDPCAVNADEEFLRPFHSNLQREFNGTYPDAGPGRDGPAPEGEELERVVRGLMLAQREDQGSTTSATSHASPTDQVKHQLQQVLVSILKELNGPLNLRPIRYEQVHGPRKNDTWAARLATRVMQWRTEMRTNPGRLTREVIPVNRNDVVPLDEAGMEVYRFVRNLAPGLIHLATPLHPDRAPPQQPYFQPYHQQHERTLSSGMRVQQMLASPIAQTPVSTPSEISHTPGTTPQYPPVQQGMPSLASSSVKRGSQDMGLLPAKRLRSSQSWDAGGGDAVAGEAGQRASAGGPMDLDAPQPRGTMTPAEGTDVLLRRVLNGISELGHKIDSMQSNMGQRFNSFDVRLRRIQDWIGVGDEDPDEDPDEDRDEEQ